MSGRTRSETEEAEVGEDFLWKRKLTKLVKATPVPETLEHALLALMPLLMALGLDKDDVEALAADCVDKMLRKLPSLPDGFRIDPQKAATIHAYTLEDPRIYDICGKAFRASDRVQGGVMSEAVMQCLPFYVLLDASLKELPSCYHFKGEVYRGVKYCFPDLKSHSDETFREYFFANRRLTWYEPKSASSDRTLMTKPQFCGFQGARTIFNVQVIQGYNIESFSYFGPQEKEVLIPMLTDLIVISRTVNMLIDKAHVDDNNSAHHKGHPDIVVLQQVLAEEPSAPASSGTVVDSLHSDPPAMSASQWLILGEEGGEVGGKDYSRNDCYIMALSIDPRHHIAWRSLGVVGGGKVGGKDYSNKDCYIMALSIDPRDHIAWRSLGTVGGGKVGGKDYSKNDCYIMALSIDPRDHFAWFRLGTVGGGKVGGKDYSKNDCYIMALSIDPRFRVGWQFLGNEGGGKVGGKDYSKKDCYIMALSIDPRDHIAWRRLGVVGGGKVGGKDYSKKDCYIMALSIDPRYHLAWFGLGNAGGGKVGGKDYSKDECYEQARLFSP